MEFYVSKVHDRLNTRVFSPEKVTSRLCLNPNYPVSLNRPIDEMSLLLDSGAFQDIQTAQRLTFDGALNRQLNFEEKVGFTANYIVSYDRIVDESPTIQGKRRKRRVDSRTADHYVEVTIDAAKYLADMRREMSPRRLVLSNQGVTPDQYVDCVKEVLAFSTPEDVIGFGGFCIIGQIRRYISDYFEVLERTLPLLKAKGIRRLHLFGVGIFRVLIKTHVMCWKNQIIPSYDTSSLELNAVFGKAFTPDTSGLGPEGVHLTQVFKRKDKYELYHPRDWAMLNIETAGYFWERLNDLYPLRGEEGD